MPLNKMQRRWSAWIFPYLFGFTVHNIDIRGTPFNKCTIIFCLGMNTLLLIRRIHQRAHVSCTLYRTQSHTTIVIEKGAKNYETAFKNFVFGDRQLSWINTFCLYGFGWTVEMILGMAHKTHRGNTAFTFIYETNSLYCACRMMYSAVLYLSETQNYGEYSIMHNKSGERHESHWIVRVKWTLEQLTLSLLDIRIRLNARVVQSVW